MVFRVYAFLFPYVAVEPTRALNGAMDAWARLFRERGFDRPLGAVGAHAVRVHALAQRGLILPSVIVIVAVVLSVLFPPVGDSFGGALVRWLWMLPVVLCTCGALESGCGSYWACCSGAVCRVLLESLHCRR